MRKPDPTKRPPRTLGPTEAAIVVLMLDGERWTFRDLAAELHKSTATIYAACEMLSERGLVSWERGRAGTMHLTCELLPVGAGV